ncbi:MAG: hypothetical protein CO129_00655 [Ignavibacteriales bacterium CG_4_9_14_3_um_filter_34_10]|nr:MAG: hypothetical protein CO129_00655 [Ignavibacteriales bacterium CG_4_9_14_3_um_filter_34_10]
MNKILLAKNLAVTWHDKLLQNDIRIIDKMNLKVANGSITAIAGLNELSLSQILKVLSGVEKPYEGEVNKSLKIGFLPSQNFIFPWLNVLQNIKLGNENKTADEIHKAIEFIGLKGYEDHFPKSKSYGFLFRVGFARMLLHDFDLLLLDSPFSKIQTKSKFEIYDLFLKSQTELKKTILFSTSTIKEAVFLADYICIIPSDTKILHEEIISFDSKRDKSLYFSQMFIEKTNKLKLSSKIF